MYDEPSTNAPPLPPPVNFGPTPTGAKGAVGEDLDDFPPLPDEVFAAPEPPRAGAKGARPARLPPTDSSKAGSESQPAPQPPQPSQNPPLPRR